MYPDVAASGIDPLEHYQFFGRHEARKPSPVFDPNTYLKFNSDINIAIADLLDFHITQGKLELRRPSVLFDPEWYLDEYQDVELSGIDPFDHWCLFGREEGRRSCGVFDPQWYEREYSDVDYRWASALEHFAAFGHIEGRRPNPWFDGLWFSKQFGLAGNSVIGAMEHLALMPNEARDWPSREFDTHWYSQQNDLAGYSIERVLAHAIKRCEEADYPRTLAIGSAGGALTAIVFDWSLPRHDRDSGSIRLWRLLGEMRGMGFEVLLGGLNQLEGDCSYIKELEYLGVTAGSGIEWCRASLEKYGHAAQVVWISRPETFLTLSDVIESACKGARIVYDSVDVHWVRLARQAEYDTRVTASDISRMRQIEREAVKGCDAAIAVTEPDAQELVSLGAGKTIVIPNVHIPLRPMSESDLEANSDIVFVGGFAHAPNVDAVRFFIEYILEGVIEIAPYARFNIVGTGAERHLGEISHDAVTVHGYVQDLPAFLRTQRLMVVPLRYGAGMKGKIGSAMEVGLPVVTTPIGAEGMALEHERSALIAQDTREFIDDVISMLTDAKYAHQVGHTGWEHARDHFSSQNAREGLHQALLW